jgi:hypothetical protein
LQVAHHRSGLARLDEIADGAVVRRLHELILIHTGIEESQDARHVGIGMVAPQILAQLGELRFADGLGARGLIDQLRRAVEVLRIDGGLDLGRPQLIAHLGNALIERRESRIVGIDAAHGLERLQRRVELLLIQGRLHPADEDFRKTLQSLLRFAVAGSEQQGAAIERQGAAFRRLDEVPIAHRDLRRADQRVDLLLGCGRGRRLLGGLRRFRCGRNCGGRLGRMPRIHGGRQRGDGVRASQEHVAATSDEDDRERAPDRRQREARARLALGCAGENALRITDQVFGLCHLGKSLSKTAICALRRDHPPPGCRDRSFCGLRALRPCPSPRRATRALASSYAPPRALAISSPCSGHGNVRDHLPALDLRRPARRAVGNVQGDHGEARRMRRQTGETGGLIRCAARIPQHDRRLPGGSNSAAHRWSRAAGG